MEAEHSEKAGLVADKEQLREELVTANTRIEQLEEATKDKNEELQSKETRLEEAAKRETELVAKLAELERVIEAKDKEVVSLCVLYLM